jgi:hypothetical protein
MENEFYTDEFEQLLKEKADQFSMYPSKRVWHSIYNNLHPSRRWPSVVMSLLLISSLILIGYLNTGENSITRQINSSSTLTKSSGEIITSSQKINSKIQFPAYSKMKQQSGTQYNTAFEDVITNETDFYTYTVVKSNRPVYLNTATAISDIKFTAETPETNNNDRNIVQTVNTYIKSNQIFADIAVFNKKNKTITSKSSDNNNDNVLNKNNTDEITPQSTDNIKSALNPVANPSQSETAKEVAEANTNPVSLNVNSAVTNEEKAWIENYALQNKPAAKKWKGRLGYQFYVTPAVNYRKLTTKVKGSATPFATTGDINNSISQKPGFGFEAGLGLNYAIAKRLQFKAGLQFNYTNYDISADQASHPIVTTILLNDPSTGYSYSAARTSTISNSFNTAASRPVTLHNRTYQVSLPIGFAYKLSSHDNVEWFAAATLQPSYYFGGKAHLISTDLKSYVSDPSSISSWNLNLGFETYMNFKLGTYNLQIGPQVRYQVNSTYKRDVALIEKPYAIGLKFGLTKGF